MSTTNSEKLLIALLAVACTGAVVGISNAETWCEVSREVWRLELVEKTVDGVPVDDLSEYEGLNFSLGESHVYPLGFYVYSSEDQRDEVFSFDFEVEDQ
jgi:hypothetical protein